MSTVDALSVDSANLSAGIGRLRVFTDVFQRALRREFLHDATSFADWDSKIRLLSGIETAAREVSHAIPERDSRHVDSASRPGQPDVEGHAAAGSMRRLSAYYAGLIECFINGASRVMHPDEGANAKHRGGRPSRDVLQRLNRVLARIVHLETVLAQWQREIGAHLAGADVASAHRDIPVPFAWDSRFVVEQAFETAHKGLEGRDSAAICILTRQLFLANYYHAALSPEAWHAADCHRTVDRWHHEALDRLDRLASACSDAGDAALNRQCVHSVQWRIRQLTDGFSPPRFFERATVPQRDLESAGDEEQVWDLPVYVRSGENDQLRVLLFGPARWQRLVEKRVQSHVAVISGSDALLQRDQQAAGFHRIVVHYRQLNETEGPLLRKLFSRDPRVLVVNAERSAEPESLPALWQSEMLKPAQMDANWLVTHCTTLSSSATFARSVRQTGESARLRVFRQNRREAFTDLACHLVDRFLHRFVEAQPTTIPTAPEQFDQIKSLIATIADEDDQNAAHPFTFHDQATAEAALGAVERIVTFLATSDPSSLESSEMQYGSVANAASLLERTSRGEWVLAAWLVLSWMSPDSGLEIGAPRGLAKQEETRCKHSRPAPRFRLNYERSLVLEHGFTKATLLETLRDIATHFGGQLVDLKVKPRLRVTIA